MNSKPLETTPANGGALRYRSGSTNLDTPLPPSRRKVVGIYAFALLLALALFYFHLVVIFDVLGQMLRYKAWLLENMEPGNAGKLLLLGCFFALMSAHVAQAAVWGLYLRSTRLLPSITEGVYFTAASITTLGYGDVLLKHPWRHLGTLIAITGVLMFGCSTAFPFVVLQAVWQHFWCGR